MSKNNTAQRDNVDHELLRNLSALERDVLDLFNQLSEADQRHVIRVLQALRATPS